MELKSMIYVFDTNLLIYHLQNNPAVIDVFDKIKKRGNNGVISIISKIELFGFHDISKIEELKANELMLILEIAGVDDIIADKSIDLRKEYKLKTPDAIIAATALVYNVSLVTADIDLEKINDLKIVNPFK